jgi:hypothetical protein
MIAVNVKVEEKIEINVAALRKVGENILLGIGVLFLLVVVGFFLMHPFGYQ